MYKIYKVRKLVSIQYIVDVSIQRLRDYIEKHEGRLISAIRNDTVNTIDNRMTITREKIGVLNN